MLLSPNPKNQRQVGAKEETGEREKVSFWV